MADVLSKMARAIDPDWWARYDEIMAGASEEVKQGWQLYAKQQLLPRAQAALDASGLGALRGLDEQTSAAPWTHTAMQRDADADFVIACVRYVRDLLASPSGEG